MVRVQQRAPLLPFPQPPLPRNRSHRPREDRFPRMTVEGVPSRRFRTDGDGTPNKQFGIRRGWMHSPPVPCARIPLWSSCGCSRSHPCFHREKTGLPMSHYLLERFVPAGEPLIKVCPRNTSGGAGDPPASLLLRLPGVRCLLATKCGRMRVSVTLVVFRPALAIVGKSIETAGGG